MDTHLRQRMREFYETSEAYREHLTAHDAVYLRRYIRLVGRFAPPGSRILDIGCGNGMSAHLLNELGYDVVGVDISPLLLEGAQRWENQRLRYKVCDVLELPFEGETFDVICANELIEHLPDVERALGEMIRVVRKGGKIILRGPNLCSPLTPLLDWLGLVIGKTGRPVWAETRRQAIQHFLFASRVYLRKRLSRQPPRFLYRDPDLGTRTIGGDADSAYYANPIDLVKFFEVHNCRVIKKCVGFNKRGWVMATATPYLSTYISIVVEK